MIALEVGPWTARRWAAVITIALTSAIGGIWGASPAAGTIVFARPSDAELASTAVRIFAARDDGSRARRVTRGTTPMLSPNGRLIAFFRTVTSGTSHLNDRSDLWVVDAAGRRPRRLMRGVIVQSGRYPYRPVTWSASGKWLILPGQDDGSVLVEVATGRRRTIPEYSPATFSPGGTRLAATYGVGAYAQGQSAVAITDLRGRRRRFVSRGRTAVWGPAGVALVRGDRVVLFERPGISRRSTVLADLSYTDGRASIASWPPGGSHLLAGELTGGTADAPDLVYRALSINVGARTSFMFPTPLTAAYAPSRDGEVVLGQRGKDVVVEHRDGTVDVVAANADSASWTR